MIAIHTKYISPTNTRGARIKAYTAAIGGKGFAATIPYPYDLSYEAVHFKAVKALIEKHNLDWDTTAMRWSDSADGKGYVFCFAHSIIEV
jgi:hypothetical protein